MEKGIVYFSSIPNGVNPSNLELFLSQQFGEVSRIFLNPYNEGSSVVSRNRFTKRIKKYKDGYVEFFNKADAVLAASKMNMRQCDFLGKRHRSSGASWNVRFVPYLQWEAIVERKESDRSARMKRLKERKDAIRNENTRYYSNSLLYTSSKKKARNE